MVEASAGGDPPAGDAGPDHRHQLSNDLRDLSKGLSSKMTTTQYLMINSQMVVDPKDQLSNEPQNSFHYSYGAILVVGLTYWTLQQPCYFSKVHEFYLEGCHRHKLFGMDDITSFGSDFHDTLHGL